MKALSFSLFFFALLSHADTLERVNMDNVPVLDQGNLGICYSYSAAQMLDAWRFTHGGDKTIRTSPIDGAIVEYSKRIEKDDPNFQEEHNLNTGGFSCDVINALNEKGLCPIENVRIEKDQPAYRAQLMTELSDLFYTQKRNPEPECAHLLQKAFPELTDIEKINAALRQDNVMTFMSEVLTKDCAPDKRTPTGGPVCHSFPDSKEAPILTPKEYETELDKQLSIAEPKQPVSIGFCSRLLREGSGYKGIHTSEDDGFRFRRSDCGGHEALIIGTRVAEFTNPFGEEKKIKQYLIRNSWGTDSKYNSLWEHEKGNIWISAEDLLPNIDKISYLSEK